MTTRPEPPIAGDDTATMLGSLERQRATFAWKCAGVGQEGLQATVGASNLTLGGSASGINPDQRAPTLLKAIDAPGRYFADVRLGTPRYLVADRRRGIAETRDRYGPPS